MREEEASEIVKGAFGSRPDFPSGKEYVDELRGHDIREGLDKIIEKGILEQWFICDTVEVILTYLHSEGLVRKVEESMSDFIVCPCDSCTAVHKLIDEYGYFCDLTCGLRTQWINRMRGHRETIEAGYTLTEPLGEKEEI